MSSHPGGEKLRAVYLQMSTESGNLSSPFTAGPAGPTKHYFFKACYATHFLFPFPFSFLLTLKVKNTVYLGDGYIWLQLVESFSNLGLYLSEELLTVEPARGTGYQTILLKKQHKALKRNARTHPRHTSSPVLIKQNHQWEKTPAVYILIITES